MSLANIPINMWGHEVTLGGLLYAEMVAKQLNVAFLACILWEIVITLDQNIEIFWKRRWTLSKYMFYFNRLESIIVMATNTLLSLTPSPSDRFCTSITWVQMVGTSSLIAVINYTMLSRIYVLWGLSRRIFVVCICAFIINVGLYICSSAYLVATSHATGAPPPFTGCQLSSFFKYEYAFFAVSIGFETMVIVLIVIKSYPIVRLRGVKAPFYSLLFEDGVAFFCAALISQLLTFVSLLSPSLVTLPILTSSPSLLVIGLACNRLILRSQRLLQNRGSDLPNSATSWGPAAGITAEFHNRDDSNMANYSMGEDPEPANTRQDKKVQTHAKTPRIETGSLPMQSLETHQEGQHRSRSPTVTCEA